MVENNQTPVKAKPAMGLIAKFIVVIGLFILIVPQLLFLPDLLRPPINFAYVLPTLIGDALIVIGIMRSNKAAFIIGVVIAAIFAIIALSLLALAWGASHTPF